MKKSIRKVNRKVYRYHSIKTETKQDKRFTFGYDFFHQEPLVDKLFGYLEATVGTYEFCSYDGEQYDRQGAP